MTAHDASTRRELQDRARRIRNETWQLAERWSELVRAQAGPTGPVARIGGDPLQRFGEIPAFLAALARAIEQPESTQGIDDQLRAAALDHARARVRAGYDQRELLLEFTALRAVMWEHFARDGGADRPTFACERAAHLALDRVLVEVADLFVHELTEELTRRAERDPLTGLYNRQAFHERLARELARARRFEHELTVVTIDLDAFKQVNDTLGHLAGDAVLERLAVLLTTHTREQDIVARLGGDEFVVALVEAGLPAAHDLIRRLRVHLVPARRQFGLPRAFGISFGAAIFPDDGNTVEQLLFRADSGLYRQKGPGRGALLEQVGHAPKLDAVRVLVADDDPDLRELARVALERDGFDVIEAADGVEAFERARSCSPDVLLLDLVMPGLDGWQLMEQLRLDPATSQLPVIVLTGSADLEHVDRAAHAGVNDFVEKPFSPTALVASVHHVLEMLDQAGAPDHAVHSLPCANESDSTRSAVNDA